MVLRIKMTSLFGNFRLALFIRPALTVFNRLQMLLDNTGDDSDRHATVFINVRHGKETSSFLPGVRRSRQV